MDAKVAGHRAGGLRVVAPADAAVLAAWRAWLATPAGCRYLARRVRVGARYAVTEAAALERWLAARVSLNDTH
jgi:hypothetical protein